MQVPCFTFNKVHFIQGSQFWSETYCLFVAHEEFEHVLQFVLDAGFVSHTPQGDIHHCDVCMGCTTAIKRLRIHKCVTVDDLLTLSYFTSLAA